jgi:oligosaccharide translocation protein RFT1
MLSIAFLFLAWAFSNLFGPIGFIAANCVNFAFRIVHNFYVIETRRQNLKLDLVSML